MQKKILTGIIVIIVILIAVFLFDGYQKNHQGYQPSDAEHMMMQDSSLSEGKNVKDIEADLQTDIQSFDKDFADLDSQIKGL